MNNLLQQQKALAFRALHAGEALLILPNIWDPLGAALLEDLGFPAVATASASISYTRGVGDGENLEFPELILVLKKISSGVNIPVTADIESGYARTDDALRENIRQVIAAGVVGINIEDYDLETKGLFPVNVQCQRLRIIRETAESQGVSLFINARTDVYAKPGPWKTDDEKWVEARNRGHAYLSAGADGIYPITLNKEREIQRLVDALACPVNILAIPGVPEIKRLKEMGVARLSLGPGFLKAALRAMKAAALQLKEGKDLSSITDNEISSDYLKRLVDPERHSLI